VSALDSGHYGAVDDASDEAALDGRGEAVDLSSDDGAERFCCAGRAALCNEREHDLKWLRDPRYTPEAGSGVLPVEILDLPGHEYPARATDPVPAAGSIEIDVAGGHRLRISGAYDPDALARLIRGCPHDPGAS
jgi:hypothetical protein